MHKHWILISALAFGCSSDKPKSEIEKTTKSTKVMKPLSKEQLKTAVQERVRGSEKCKKGNKVVDCTSEVGLVPSPAEMQKALKNNQILEKLVESTTTCKDATFGENQNRNAVVIGVIMADLALTLDGEADNIVNKPEKTTCLNKMKDGFAKLKAGDDIPTVIDSMVDEINNSEMKPAKLLTDFDNMSLVIVPELEYSAGDWVVPLIQAGSWLKGSNLVSKAITKAGKSNEAGHLLQQPHVVDYFLRYVQQSAKGKTSETVNQKLISTLTTLKGIAEKEKLSQEDIQTISASTDDVLSVLNQ